MVRIEFERKVGPKGQIVIPKEIRKIFKIEPNMKVLVGIEDKKITIRLKEDPLEFFEKVAAMGRTIKEVDLDKLYEEWYER